MKESKTEEDIGQWSSSPADKGTNLYSTLSQNLEKYEQRHRLNEPKRPYRIKHSFPKLAKSRMPH